MTDLMRKIGALLLAAMMLFSPEAALRTASAAEVPATATDVETELTAAPTEEPTAKPTPEPTPMPPAEDITQEVAFNGYWGPQGISELRDNRYQTYWTSVRRSGVCSLTVTAPKGKKVGGLLIRWRSWPLAVSIQVPKGDQWETVTSCDGDFAAQYIPIPDLQEFRIISRDDDGWSELQICEITVVTAGSLPEDFQIWRKPPMKVDMMLIEGHPDDEVLWFGGLLPTYAGEQGKNVLVVNGSFNNYLRRLELLDSLWTCGVDIYPVLLNYIDAISWNIEDVYAKWGGRDKVDNDIVKLYRQFRPDVVVLHAENGESGHGAHQVLSDAGRRAVSLAAQKDYDPENVMAYGVWQVPKVYVHLWEKNRIRMDWHVPLERFGGLDGMAVATMGFEKHLSQQGRAYSMKEGGETDNSLFGLFYSSVGLDVEKNDMFEHIGDGE